MTNLIVTSKNQVEANVKEQFKDFLEGELKKVKIFIDEALISIEGQMLLAKNNGISYDQADIHAELDLSDFSEVVRKEVYQSLISSGWEICNNPEKAGSILIKP